MVDWTQHDEEMRGTAGAVPLTCLGAVVFGIKIFQMPLAEKRWATLSRRGVFVSDDGSCGCDREN